MASLAERDAGVEQESRPEGSGSHCSKNVHVEEAPEGSPHGKKQPSQ